MIDASHEFAFLIALIGPKALIVLIAIGREEGGEVAELSGIF